MDAIARVDRLGLSNDENKAYKLYGELCDVIFRKMNDAVQDDYFTVRKEDLEDCLWANYYICKSILSLPLVNFDKGMELCTRMIDSTLTKEFSVFELSEQKLTDEERTDLDHQNLVNDFKKLGMFFAFENKELAGEILPAAQYATSVGMKMPLFMAEMTVPKGSGICGSSNDIVGVKISNIGVSKVFKGFSLARNTFYHEITHHARSAVGAFHADKSIAGQNLESAIPGLKDNANLVDAIKDQISDYALTDSEEYIAEFSALVLCCLEHNKNPFSYIKDARLWRLYYEFGGPDHAREINEITTKKFGRNILTDKSCNWCSGYPSKFDINVEKLSNEFVLVRNISPSGDLCCIHITSTTILPPPPLGYCYTTENGKLQLKDVKSGKCYDSIFCSLTNGPLSLVCAYDTSDKKNPIMLQHHFELFQ